MEMLVMLSNVFKNLSFGKSLRWKERHRIRSLDDYSVLLTKRWTCCIV